MFSSYNIDIETKSKMFSCLKLLNTAHGMDGMELPNQEKKRTHTEKETYTYFGILEADAIKQVEMREELFWNISEERESYSKPN